MMRKPAQQKPKPAQQKPKPARNKNHAHAKNWKPNSPRFGQPLNAYKKWLSAAGFRLSEKRVFDEFSC
jgi:hypothetical protein